MVYEQAERDAVRGALTESRIRKSLGKPDELLTIDELVSESSGLVLFYENSSKKRARVMVYSYWAPAYRLLWLDWYTVTDYFVFSSDGQIQSAYQWRD